MRKIVSVVAIGLISTVYIDAQQGKSTLSPGSFYNYALAALNPQAANFDAIIAELFVQQGLEDEERADELSTLVNKFGAQRGEKIKKLIEQFEAVKAAGGLDAFLSARDQLPKCKAVVQAFTTFKQAVDREVVPDIKRDWNLYLQALTNANMSLDEQDKTIQAKVAALREVAPEKPFAQTWQALRDTKAAFEKSGYSEQNLPAFQAAVEAFDKQSAKATKEQQEMLLVAKSVVNVFAGKDVFKETTLMSSADVLLLAMKLTESTNKDVRNAIAAAYYVVPENDRARVKDGFSKKFGGKDIEGLGLAVLVPNLNDSEINLQYAELKQCNPGKYEVDINA